MKVLVSGASGMIGSALVPALRERGHDVVRLGRSARAPEDARWDPKTGSIEREKLAGVDAAVHLAGENLSRRWSESGKTAIMKSRAKGTQLLAETLAALEPKPRVLVSASAVGFYGSRGDEILTEESSRGLGFLAGVCRAWEDGTRPAAAADIRVAVLRFGIVLSAKGGALGRLLTPFRLGLGGPIAGGEQYMSWIAIDDVIGLIECALEDQGLSGPTNAVAPEPVTNAEFTKTLARVLGRPAFMPLPGMALKLAFGEMADEVLLASQRVEPKRALAAGYQFKYPELEGALRHVLGK